VPIFALSRLLGYMYERTGNLWVSVLMHAMFNGFTIIIKSRLALMRVGPISRIRLTDEHRRANSKILSRRCERILSEEDLPRKLERSAKSGRPLRIKMGWTRRRRT